VFRSVVLPALGVALNLLSVGAAYGLLVLVFQHGVGAGVFGFQKVETIEPAPVRWTGYGLVKATSSG
jgi:putative drug exporter of the RND superfamily